MITTPRGRPADVIPQLRRRQRTGIALSTAKMPGGRLFLFQRLFRKSFQDNHGPISHPATPEGLRIYAVADIHGRADLLTAMEDVIGADLVHSPCAAAVTVFTGDYVDRGPHSWEVVERLSSGPFVTQAITLRGNHEALFLKFLEDPLAIAEGWRQNGGLETLLSYGVDAYHLRRGASMEDMARSFQERVPGRHLDFLNQLPLSVTLGDYFFCHAGVRPGVRLEDQRESDLLWIREEFLGTDSDFGKVVVHGHTPVPRPEVRRNRINIDTGAYMTNRLTCLVLEGRDQRFLWT